MLEKYPRLVETVIEFKRYSRRILAEHKGLEYSEQPDARVIDMASNYRLQYNEPDDTYYCLQGAQTLEQRVKYLEFNDVSKPAIPNENQACQGQGQQVAESAPPAPPAALI